jgi:signal transduction histidine kinase
MFLDNLKNLIKSAYYNSLDNKNDLFKLIPNNYFLIKKDTTIIESVGIKEILSLENNLIGKKLKNILPKLIKTQNQRIITQILETKKSNSTVYKFQFEKNTKFIEAQYFYYSENKIIIFLKDITESIRKEDLRKRELNKLKTLDKVRKDLITNISHEIKTPIMTISNSSEILMDIFKNQFNRESLEFIEMIKRGSNRLLNLVNTLIDLSKIEFKKLDFKLRNINLKDIVTNCINNMKFFIKEKKINLKFNLKEDINILLDQYKIEQTIINLLSNAIKNTPPNGYIEIILLKEGDKAKLVIEDSGIGLTKKELNKIFTMFCKIKRNEKDTEYLDIRGSGLGLYLSKKNIEAHGGRIWAESEGRFKGSSFIIELPFSHIKKFGEIL